MNSVSFLEVIMKWTLLLFSSVAFLISCQTAPQLTSNQRRVIQTKHFVAASYENVFRSFKTVLQDEGYIIMNQDKDGGLIVAEATETIPFSNHTLASKTMNHPFMLKTTPPQQTPAVKTLLASINLESVSKDLVEARIVLREKDIYVNGMRTGREIINPRQYRNLFVQVLRQIEYRKALGHL